MNLRPWYIVDLKGRRKGVILSVKQFEAMLREIEDLRDALFVEQAEAAADGFTDLTEMKRVLLPE